MPAPSPADQLRFAPLLDAALDSLARYVAPLRSWPGHEAALLGPSPDPSALAFVRNRITEMQTVLDVRARRAGSNAPMDLLAGLHRTPHDDPALQLALVRWLELQTAQRLPPPLSETTPVVPANPPPPAPASPPPASLASPPVIPLASPLPPATPPADPLPSSPAPPHPPAPPVPAQRATAPKRIRPDGYLNTSIVLDDPGLRAWFGDQAATRGSQALVLLDALTAAYTGQEAAAQLAQLEARHAGELAALRADHAASLAALETTVADHVAAQLAAARTALEAAAHAAALDEAEAQTRDLARWLWPALTAALGGSDLPPDHWAATQARLLAAVLRARRPGAPLAAPLPAAFADSLLDAVADALTPTAPQDQGNPDQGQTPTAGQDQDANAAGDGPG